MIFFVILLLLACILLGLIILIQNPKGGGLAGNVAGFSNQFMGVKQTNDVLEKGTWIFAAVIGVLCLFSTFFVSGSKSGAVTNGRLQDISTQPVQQAQPQATPAVPFNNGVQQQQPAQAAPKPDSGK